MKSFVMLALLLFTVETHAALDSANIKGKIVSFDHKIVTIEIAGETYKFNREKLGPQFVSIRKGDVVELSIDKATTR